jgi:hypothetical protein
MGQDNSMVIVLNGHLPKDAPNYTVSASPNEIRLKAGYDEIATIPYYNEQVFNLLTTFTQVGIVEYEPPKEAFPNCITNVAYVQTRSH